MSNVLAGMRMTKRWTTMRYHRVQAKLWRDFTEGLKRFFVVAAGRRSGKSEIFKRGTVIRAMEQCQYSDAWYGFGAPTHQQAKRIYWYDLKRLVPRWAMMYRPSESDLMITLINGARLVVGGFDKPERWEGIPLSGLTLDEYGNMKEQIWTEHMRPSLSDRNGWCAFTGVPEGMNHYARLAKRAQIDRSGKWGWYHWVSADILPAEEIADAKADLDELSYMQEYEASFVNFTGRAYYPFTIPVHGVLPLNYNANLPLIFCFDFNVSPGVAAVCQEQKWLGGKGIMDDTFTAVIGEVYIPRNSTTERVCKKLITDWGHHKGEVFLYGDATGGAKGSAKVQGSDWDIIRSVLRQNKSWSLKFRVKESNPPERSRVNALNCRLKTADGKVHMLIDPVKAPKVIEDFEGVTVIEGGSGELDKDSDSMLTHLTDALGYYIDYRYPFGSQPMVVTRY